MDDEWWQSNLRDLQSKPKRLETLTNMYTKINKVSTVSRHIVESILCAPALYDCLTIEGADKEPLVNLATDFIRLCLDLINLDPNDAKLPQLLAQALSHPNALLRALVLNELRREMVRQSDAPPLPNSELLIYVLDELQRPETLCSGAAVDILTLKITPWLTDPAIQTKLMQLLKQNEVIRCRAYELGVTLAKLNSASLSSVEFILDAALSELDNDDVLLQASVMEILVPLAEQNHGLSYMERRRVFEIISDRVHRMENNPLDTLLIPSIMKFFGKIAAIQPHKIIVGYPQMMACLFELLQSGDETIMPTGMDTMANLASSVQGKMLMHVQFQSAMKQLLQKYSEYMRTLSSNVKIRLLNSLHVIYTLEAAPGNELNNIMKEWYLWFAGGLQINHIVEQLNRPFPDLQLAALGLLKTLCKYTWGIQAVQRTAGAIEFLLSRQRDLHRDVKYLKWEIMEMLSVSSEFTPTEIVRFTAFVNEGPYHQQANVNVATEPQGNH